MNWESKLGGAHLDEIHALKASSIYTFRDFGSEPLDET